MSPTLRRALCSCLTGVLAVPAAAGDLERIVPTDVYLYVHSESVPGGEIIDGYYDEVFAALVDARFDESIVDMMVATSPASEAEKIRQIHEVVVSVVSEVPWAQLCEKEVVFAEAMRAHANNFGSTILVASTLEPEVVPSANRGLLQLMLVAVQLGQGLGDGLELDLQLVVTEEGARNVYTGDAVAAQGMRHAGRPGTTLEYALEIEGYDAVALAFQDDTMLLGFNLGCRDLVASCLALRGGEPTDVEPLTESERYRETMAMLPREGAASTVYLDFPNMFEPLQDFVYGTLVRKRAEPRWFSLAEDAFSLFEALDSVGAVTHYDGYRQVDTSVFRWADDPATYANPLYLAGKGRGPVNDLLALVPAEATGFTVHQGFDLVPLYHWAQGMVREYVPNGNVLVGQLAGLEALFAVDIERDVLEYLGSPFVSVSLPPREGATGMAAMGESITIQRVADPERLQALDERFETMIEAWMPVFQGVVGEHAGGNPFLGFEIEVGEPLARYPDVKEWAFTIPMIGRLPMVTGYVGDLAVMGSSEATLEHVLAAGRGDVPRFAGGEGAAGLLPEGEPLASASMIGYDAMLQSLATGLGVAGSVMNWMSMGMSGDAEAAPVFKAIGGIIPKVSRVLQSMDFFDRTVSYSELPGEDGLVCFTHATTLYKTPEQRRSWR